MLSKILIMIDKSPPRLAKMHLLVRKDDIFYLPFNRMSSTPSFIPRKESVRAKNFQIFTTATWSTS